MHKLQSIDSLSSFWSIPRHVWQLGTVIFAAALAIRLTVLFYSSIIAVDDAYIIFRVARNIANGDGYIYNIGDRVQAVSSPLYGLIVAALWWFVDDRSILIVRLLGGFADAFVAFWIVVLASACFRLSQPDRISLSTKSTTDLSFAAFAGIFYAGLPTSSLIATIGLETGFYTLTIVVTFWCLVVRSNILAAMLSGVAMLLRPDGALLAMVVLITLFFRDRRIPFKEMLSIFLVIAPYELFSLQYYESIIPQTIIAKKIISRSPIEQWIIFLNKYFIGNPIVILIGIIYFIGIGTAILLHRYLLAVLSWSILYVVCFSTFAIWWPWYFPPAMIGYSIAFGLGLSIIINVVSMHILPQISRGLIITSVAIVLLLALSLQTIQKAKSSHSDDGLYKAQRQELAQWVNNHSPSNATVMLEPLGLVGFLTDRRFHDYPGLVSREVTDSLHNIGRPVPGKPIDPFVLLNVIEHVKPTIVILREDEYEVIKDTKILVDYKLVHVSRVDRAATERHKDFQNMYILYRNNT